MARVTTKLDVESREPSGSREARRMRRAGRVPGVIYGGGEQPLAFQVDERELRHALAAAGAVLDISVDGKKAVPVVLKDSQRHPVRGETTHVDLLRVRLDQTIHAVVTLELVGAEDAPGVREGGVLEQVTRELRIEALPTSIPESITHDVSTLAIGDLVTLADIVAPPGVTLLDDPEETIATLTPPRVATESGDEIESETEVVGGTAAGESAAGSGAQDGDAE